MVNNLMVRANPPPQVIGLSLSTETLAKSKLMNKRIIIGQLKEKGLFKGYFDRKINKRVDALFCLGVNSVNNKVISLKILGVFMDYMPNAICEIYKMFQNRERDRKKFKVSLLKCAQSHY